MTASMTIDRKTLDAARERRLPVTLSDEQVQAFGAEIDAVRQRIMDSLGEDDARYIRRLIKVQRSLEVAGRGLLFAGILPPAWLAGTALLSVAKILENMEIGHNVMHGQWDWMRDPQIHSSTWEWDNVCPAEQWKHSHNYMHHKWTNVVGMDRDVGYGILPPAWLAGTALLSVAKILENMEIGHNVMHGQWDWMRDPQIHSSTWEWDNVCPAEQWKHSHNYMHHKWTNVVGMDRDVGYGILRMSEKQKWSPAHLAQPVNNALLALLFEWGVALHDVEFERVRSGKKSRREAWQQLKVIGRKVRKQVAKDYVVFPLLAGPFFLPVLAGNITANLVRNLWAYMIIFCGHFPDGVEDFLPEDIENEDKAHWYLRQLLGSANISGGKLLHIMSGNLSHQMEHHLFPDMPSNRYAEAAKEVRAICEKYGLPYNSKPLHRQFGSVMRKVLRLSLPNRAPKEVPATA